MGNRRKGREAALQLLFLHDLSGGCADRVAANFWTEHPVDDETREFAERLLGGTLDHLPAIDEAVTRYSSHWRLNRMAAVDRNVLRLAVFELCHCPDIPIKVSLNEAIEIAKKFGSEDSGAFVNGILDQVAKTVKK